MKYSLKIQYAASILFVLGTALLCFMASSFLGHSAVALVLLVAVSLLAMVFDIWPVLLSALLSALILNFFFIPPRFTLHINAPDDVLMFLMYFLIAMVNAVLTNKIKVQEKKARDKEDKEKTIRLYNTLLNSLSHELKTPIATIVGATDTLKENDATLSPPLKSTLLLEIELAGHRLNRQVENLLNMSRLESGMLKVKKDWCDMSELIYMVIQKLDPEAQKRITFAPGSNLPLFKLDIGLMEQAVYNIVYNAIQYTPAEAQVNVVVKNQDDQCVISIADEGPGFAEHELPNIFDTFYRLPQSKPGGTGLGLSIAKGFVEAHGGTIRVENNKGGGAQFRITLPTETSFLNYIKHE
jgi:two-component system, OmpR family, sensor histidine kinase KdpD